MRFRDHRQICLTGIDTPDLPKLSEPNTTPEQLATPRYISPAKSGYIAAEMANKKAPQRMPNRADRRKAVFSGVKVIRRRGVALSPKAMPWKVEACSPEEIKQPA